MCSGLDQLQQPLWVEVVPLLATRPHVCETQWQRISPLWFGWTC